jgi:hypothetical protein
VDEAEVTQGMSVAERMKDVVRLEVGTVGIMDDNACAFGQNADGIQRLRTPLCVQLVMR